MRSPRFSVITVHFNEIDALISTVQSVWKQNYSNIEHIIVDGYSTDGARDYLQKNASRFGYSYISEPDAGLYDAMNKGIELAAGEFLIFLNAGDFFCDSETLSKLNNALKEVPNVKLAYGHTIEITVKGEKYLKKAKPIESIWYGIPARHQSMVFHADSLGSIRYFEWMRVAADQAFVYEFVEKVGMSNCQTIDLPVSKFQQGGISSRNEIATMKELLWIRRKVMGYGLFRTAIFTSYQMLVRLVIRYFPKFYNTIRYR